MSSFAIFAFLIVFFSFQKSIFKFQATNLDGVKKTQPKKKTLADVKIAGTTAYWDGKNAQDALKTALPYLDSYSPTLYQIEPDGSLGKIDVEYRQAFLDLAKEAKKPITPNVGDGSDSERVSLLLGDSSIQEKFLQSMVNEAKKEGFTGWVVDIEALKIQNEKAFTAFIKKAGEILHRNDLKLKVVVFAKTESNGDNPAEIVENYKDLGLSADEIWIMLFGFSNEDTQPGGQTPPSWLRGVLSYTKTVVPKEKIVVVLSTHGYDWTGGTAEILDYPQVEERIKKNQAAISYDKNLSSEVATYSENGKKHVIWFEDAQTISQKLQIALNEFDIDQFALWRIGAEDPKIWESFKK